MKVKMTAYRNYGVLAHEKRPFYTINGPCSSAVVSEKITIILPEDWKAVKNKIGTILFELPDGETLIAQQVVDNECNSDDHVMFNVNGDKYCVKVENRFSNNSGKPAEKPYRIIGFQFPLEEGISSKNVIGAMTGINCEGYDFYRVDGQASSAYFVFDFELFAEFQERELLPDFERFIQEILDDVNQESKSEIYQFNGYDFWFGYAWF